MQAEEVVETYLMPTYLQKGKEEKKQGILDVRVFLKKGTQIGIEMQVNYFEYWDERILFYLCKMFTEQLMKDDPYGKLQRCIHVSILDFIHSGGSRVLPENTFQGRKDREAVFR